MKNILWHLWILIPLLLACDKETDPLKLELTVGNECEQRAIVDQELYENETSFFLLIEELEIIDDCLRVKYSSSGCTAESWNLRLIGSQYVAYSYPPQRNIRFVLENNELCEAHFTREMTFDISPFRSNDEAMLLNVIGTEHQLMYPN